MKKVLSILVALALVVSCCGVAAFAAEASNYPIVTFLSEVADWAGGDVSELGAFGVECGAFEAGCDINANVTTEQIAKFLGEFVKAGKWDVEGAEALTESMVSNGYIDADQMSTINTEIESIAAGGSGDPGSGDPGSGDPGSGDPGSGDPGSGDPGSGDSGSILDGLGDITDIFSGISLDGLDLSKFLEGAKSSIGQFFEGIKGAGLPDIGSLFSGLDIGSLFSGDGLSSITGLLSGLPLIGDLFSMFGGGDDSGNGSGSGSGGSGSGGSGLINNGGNTNTTTIPKTADNAPYVAVASLAVLAGVAFVLTRKKNEE